MRALLLGALLLAAAGCVDPLGDDDDGPGRVAYPGLLAFAGDTTTVAAPDTVRAGASFDVAFHTYGGDCEEPGSVNVSTQEYQIVLAPVDYTTWTEGLACPAASRRMPRTVRVAFPTPGVAHLLVTGTARPLPTAAAQPLTLERRVVVVR